MKAEVEELRGLLTKSQKESQSLKSELQAQKEANSRAPTTTMKNLVERLKSQLALKEKQQKASGTVFYFFVFCYAIRANLNYILGLDNLSFE